jgi:uncharacterized protein YxeA
VIHVIIIIRTIITIITIIIIIIIIIFFLISKNSLKSAEGRNPSTQEVYKRAPKKRTETNKKVKNQRTAYYPSYAPTPKDITY